MRQSVAEAVKIRLEIERRRAKPRAKRIHDRLSAAEIGDSLEDLHEYIVAVQPSTEPIRDGWPYDCFDDELAKARVKALLDASKNLGPITMDSLLVLHRHELPLGK